MNFNEYSQEFSCIDLHETEQSKTFLVRREREQRVCKKFPSPLERSKEEFAHRYLLGNNLLSVPFLTEVGEDFLEMEFIEKIRRPLMEEIVKNICPLYSKTLDKIPFSDFPQIDLSKNKLFHRVDYLEKEFIHAGVEEGGILSRAKKFIEKEYDDSDCRCLVHGDLKSPHGIHSKNGFKFIDFGLTGIASPWYDLAFLYMEKQDKGNTFKDLSTLAYELIGKQQGLDLKGVQNLLRSGIFYRCLYNLGFALRHRPEKTIKRTKRELDEIMEK